MSAVSLVKRFVWPVYWSEELDIPVDGLKLSDTAAMAAATWLPAPASFPVDADEDPDAGPLGWQRLRRWSGQWSHWQSPQQDKDEKQCPPKVWKAIQDWKGSTGRPPTYCARLLLDGDNMGNVFRGEIGKRSGSSGSTDSSSSVGS